MDMSEFVSRTLARRRGTGAPLRIVQAGHPALRTRARDWREQLPTALLLELIEAMTRTMREAPGVGVAAPQVGIPLRLFVIEDRYAGEQEEDDSVLERMPVALRAFLDPSYEVAGPENRGSEARKNRGSEARETGSSRSRVDAWRDRGSEARETVYAWEGCLSVDGWQSIVPRPRSITFRGLEVDDHGELTPVEETHRGWPARILQHETDHLAGTICHDLAVPRSFVEARYAQPYAEMPEAVRRLGLQGEVTTLGAGEVTVRCSQPDGDSVDQSTRPTNRRMP